MATRDVFSPFGAEFPSANFPELTIDAQRRPILRFDASTDEAAYWTSIAPQGLTGTVTAEILAYMLSGTSGSVRFQVAVEAVTPADAVDLDSADSFDSDNSAGASVPATQGHLFVVSVTLTNKDGIAASDYFRVRVRRDADGTSGTDDATGDCCVLAIELRDAA